MSIQGKQLPSERTLLGVIDTQARTTAQKAAREIAPIVSRETPHKSGATAAALRPRVSRTSTGAAITVAPPRARRHPGSKATVAQLIRWVTRGTGALREGAGPKGRIRSSRRPPRRLVLPGGARRWSVKGQKPNPFTGRIQAAGTLRVERAFAEGARAAARAAERLEH